MILEVEPLQEIHPKDVPCAPIPHGGMTNGGLMKLSPGEGWLVVPTNKSTPGRRLIGKYASHLISVQLNEDFSLRSSEPLQFHAAGFSGQLHDLRISQHQLMSGCYRRDLASAWQPFFGRFNEEGVALFVPILDHSKELDRRLVRYDCKNWVHLSPYVLDCGPTKLWDADHAAMVWNGGDKTTVAVMETPLNGGHLARPSAPAFLYEDMLIASYHHHHTDARTGERTYWHQFARLNPEKIDVMASTPPLRFSHGNQHGIQFLTGAIPSEEKLVLSYGVNDTSNVIARVDMKNIIDLLS